MDNPDYGNSDHEFRIYGDDNAQTYVILDEEDYLWAVRWKWHFNKPHPGRNGTKQYMCRSQSNGRRHAPKLLLHIEIMKRSGKRKPSPLHIWVDHKNGSEYDCRRSNLRWVTPSQNGFNQPRRRNRHQGGVAGVSALQPDDADVR